MWAFDWYKSETPSISIPPKGDLKTPPSMYGRTVAYGAIGPTLHCWALRSHSGWKCTKNIQWIRIMFAGWSYLSSTSAALVPQFVGIFVCYWNEWMNELMNERPITPKRALLGATTNAFRVTTAHRPLSCAMYSADDSDWSLHPLLLFLSHAVQF